MCIEPHFHRGAFLIEAKKSAECYVQNDLSSGITPEILLVCAFLLFFSSSSFPCLNVDISVSSFIMGPECSSSQMSSPVAGWEGKHGVGGGQRKAGNVC